MLFQWDAMDDGEERAEAKRATDTMVNRLNSPAFIALYRNFGYPRPDDIPSFSDWQEERP